jgi:TPR repeat protein
MQTPTSEFLEETKRRAEAGDATAQCNLGIFYFFGQGVRRDVRESTRWYCRAAEQGDAQAQYNLGIAFDRGHGVARDSSESFRWFLAAAEGGHAESQYNVAISYGQGNGVGMDWIEAFRWIILSDQGGYQKAREVRNMVSQQMTAQQIQEAERRAKAFRPRGGVQR